MTTHAFSFLGEDLIADLCGAVFWPAQATLVVADLHLEKGTSRARAGHLLPPYDSRATLATIAAAVERHRPARVICLGDSFHDDDGPARLSDDETDSVRRLTDRLEWIWIAGNHDPAPPARLGGSSHDALTLGPLTFRHQAAARTAAGEISGHFHPKAAIDVRGRRVRGRCFAVSAERLILPAIGAYTGGLDVWDPAIASLMALPFTVLLIGRRKLYAFPADRLRPALRA